MSSKNKDINEGLPSRHDSVEDNLMDLQVDGNLDTNNRGDRISENKLEEKSDEIISADFVERENALQNHLVLECIFKSLSISDLKLVRLVCSNLNLAVDPILKKRVKIVFRDGKDLEFVNDFKDISMNQPFVSFQFRGQRFNNAKLFFEKYGKNIKNLELIAPGNYFGGWDNTYFRKFDFTPWIDPSILRKLHLKNNATDILRFSLSKFRSVKDILIKAYYIDIEEADLNRIGPVYLYLECVMFCKGKNDLKHVCVNQIFDLGKIQEMSIYNYKSTWWTTQTTLTLDMSSDKVIAEKVTLDSMTLKNLKESTWIVNDFVITNPQSDFLEKNQMKIKRFTYYGFNKVLDVGCLPETIEMLDIESYEDFKIICTQLKQLPNMRLLMYDFSESWMISCLPNLLAQCVNLVELALKGDGSCNVEHIPPSVSKMMLVADSSSDGKDMRIIGNGKLHLQKLIVLNYAPDEIKQLLSKLQSTELVLYLTCPLDTVPAILNFILENNNDVFKKIVVGQGKFQQDDFTREMSLEFVDQSAKFYLIKDRFETAVPLTNEQFKDFTILCKSNI